MIIISWEDMIEMSVVICETAKVLSSSMYLGVHNEWIWRSKVAVQVHSIVCGRIRAFTIDTNSYFPFCFPEVLSTDKLMNC